MNEIIECDVCGLKERTPLSEGWVDIENYGLLSDFLIDSGFSHTCPECSDKLWGEIKYLFESLKEEFERGKTREEEYGEEE